MRSPLKTFIATLGISFLLSQLVTSQQRTYPKEIRGYKVERAAVEMKKDEKPNGPFQSDPDTLVRFGEARLSGVTPFGIKLEIPLVIAPVTQKGRVDVLMFEEMVINGTPVEIEDYVREFDLPNKTERILDEPLRLSVNLPHAMLAGIGELTQAKETWPVTGRVYVLGHYKKFLFTFKRAVPVEIDLTIKNPMRK
jgi:hypothetical protein